MRRRGAFALACVALIALVVAGCGSSKSKTSTAASSGSGGGKCSAAIGLMAPITGQVAQLGGEQLHFAQTAVDQFNQQNGTNITLVQGDTQLMPAQATTVAQQFISNPKIVAVVGPAGSQEVSAIGPIMGRAGLGYISGSATNATLTAGANPTFLRVVAKDSVQGPQDAQYILKNLKPKSVMIIDDQTSYSTGLVSSITPVLKGAGVTVNHQSVNQKQTDFSSLASKVNAGTSVVILPWQVAANAQQFGQNLAEQHKTAVIFGTDGTYSPSQFKTAGSYVSSFGPDITAIPSDAALVAQLKAKYGSFGTFGPPTYAATTVVANAINAACKSGSASRSAVLANIKKTNEPTSILGQPITFDSHGDLNGGKFFIFKIQPNGTYKLITTT